MPCPKPVLYPELLNCQKLRGLIPEFNYTISHFSSQPLNPHWKKITNFQYRVPKKFREKICQKLEIWVSVHWALYDLELYLAEKI